MSSDWEEEEALDQVAQLTAANYFLRHGDSARADLENIAAVGYPTYYYGVRMSVKKAKAILNHWAKLDAACAKPYLQGRARNNPAPVVVAAIIQAFLPLIMSLGTKQINAYKKASTEDQIKMLKKWSLVLSVPARLALQNKKFARKVAKALSDILNDPETMDNLKEAGKAGIEVGQAYRGAKEKAPRRITAKKNVSENHRRTLEWYKAHPYYLLAVKLDSAAESYKEKGREWAYRELVRMKKGVAAYDAALNEMTDREELVRLSNRISHHVRKIDALFRSGNPYAAKKNGPTRERPHYPFAEKEKQYAKYTTEALYYSMNDAMSASKTQQGWNEAGSNWYLDDYHTIVKEIQRRKAKENVGKYVRQGARFQPRVRDRFAEKREKERKAAEEAEKREIKRGGKITLYEGRVWTGPGRSHWSTSLDPLGVRDEFTREIVVPLWLAELAEAAKGDTMAEIQFLKWLREEGYLSFTYRSHPVERTR